MAAAVGILEGRLELMEERRITRVERRSRKEMREKMWSGITKEGGSVKGEG